MKHTDFECLIKKIQEPLYTHKLPSVLEDFFSRYQLNKFKEYLSPDADHYFSPLNPSFSLELEYSPARVQFLNVLSLRDGVMPLLKFFTLNPVPKNQDIVYIVDSKLSSLVPLEWRSLVLLRDLKFEERREYLADNFSKKILFISPSPLSAPLDLVLVELRKLKEKISTSDEIVVFFSSMKLRGQGQSQRDEMWGFKILQLINKEFENEKIRVVDWREYTSIDLSHFKFHFINPLKYYFSDSYLLHDACQKGAKPILKIPHVSQGRETFYQALSMEHGFMLHQNFQDYDSFKKENLVGIIEEIEMSLENRKKNLRSNQFCSPEFASWSLDVAKNIYNKEIKLS